MYPIRLPSLGHRRHCLQHLVIFSSEASVKIDALIYLKNRSAFWLKIPIFYGALQAINVTLHDAKAEGHKVRNPPGSKFLKGIDKS